MSKDYQHEIGYKTLLEDFKFYQKQTPIGVSLVRSGKLIKLQFKTTNKSRSKYDCNCSFTLDGMIEAVKKSHQVASALKTITSEAEFWQWYDREIKNESQLENDLLTFSEAIAVVEDEFWERLSRTKRKRSKSNPSDLSSWNDTYGRFYKHLPQDKVINLKDIEAVINRQKKGTKTYKGVVSAMKRLVRLNNHQHILDELGKLDVTQTDYRELQAITLDEFLEWRDRVLGITASLHPNANLDTRKAWLWVFSMQVVYGLRIHEVFAIQNLDEPYITKDKSTIPALSDMTDDKHTVVIGEHTAIGTTTKTRYRLARPIVPPKHHNLIEILDIKNPLLPNNRPRSKNPTRIKSFYGDTAVYRLRRWNAPITETHAFRHLANHNGMQAGIPLEVRAQSMGHTPNMNDSTYKKRKRTDTTLDLLYNSNTSAIDFVNALSEAKNIVNEQPSSKTAIAALIARIYSKNIDDIVKIL